MTLFAALAAAHDGAAGVGPRSAQDKEFASEDWVAAAATAAGLAVTPQGRHAPFDFAADVPVDGRAVALALQTKGLTRRGTAAVRTSLDYNGTLPQPRHERAPSLLVYTELDRDGGAHRAASLVVADMSLVQDDASAAQSCSVPGHGSYGDMLARFRLMYVGAQPVALAADQGLDLTGRSALILPAGALRLADAEDAHLVRAGTLVRRYATRRLVSTQVFFDGRPPQPQWEPVPPRPDRAFEVWVPAGGRDGAPTPVPVQRVPCAQEQLALEF